MKTVVLMVMLALVGCAFTPPKGGKIYVLCDKRIDKEGKVHYVCDKKQMIGFGYKF